jgi:hypothetical protein
VEAQGEVLWSLLLEAEEVAVAAVLWFPSSEAEGEVQEEVLWSLFLAAGEVAVSAVLWFPLPEARGEEEQAGVSFLAELPDLVLEEAVSV